MYPNSKDGESRLKLKITYTNKLLRVFNDFGRISIIIILLGYSSAHAKINPKWVGYTESGKASYYALKFQSKKTASGELYDKAKKTAAHKKLPFGTKVKVTNRSNGKAVIVKINDRGPFVKGRIVDLSGAAFNSIANFDEGVIDVIIKVVD